MARAKGEKETAEDTLEQLEHAERAYWGRMEAQRKR
jgi:hypothetical protein